MGAPWMYCMALSTLTICFSVSVKDVTTPDRRLVTERAYEIARPTSPKGLGVIEAGYVTPHTPLHMYQLHICMGLSSLLLT